ncbi:pre-rRNA processing protein Tsr1 [Purpureocillium lavendulum]|uniref:Pre-rRNA processing protein Tsr1 n=1 Tax=Purpureocillium lavendulum TaxID=1247861 RepID=A0AB34FMU9_9HYPO|nr:pre-rRNA processing protein Tsr1 [Purpureocillium lavendulum]
MAVTRNAGRPSAPAALGRRNPGRSSRAASRSSKRPFYHETTDTDGDDDSASSSAASEPDEPDVADLDISPPQSGNASRRQRQAASSSRSAAGNAHNPADGKPAASAAKNSKYRVRKRTSPPLSPVKKRKLSPEREEKQATFIPDWRDPRISFECWSDIFHYAARMTARMTTSPDDLAAGWLVHAATTCRAFAEPALTALYHCPVIKHSLKAKRLSSLLGKPPTDTFCNYRAKVETLLIDIHIVPHGALRHLIQPLPRLTELIIYTPLDQPPYRQLDRSIRWHYPSDIFRALEPSIPLPDGSVEKPFPTCLKSWEWSGRLVGGYVSTLDSIVEIHQTPSFSKLTKLALTNFQVPSLSNLHQVPATEEGELQTYHEDGIVIDAVAKAILQLENLDHLIFESSTVMNDRLLPLLPGNLGHLELINCWEIKSEDLAQFLRTHAANLRTLSLLHNQSLDLAFLTDLAETCPNLRELHMNLSYYRHHDTINDSGPMYDQALLPDQVPTWPSTLRVINVENVRYWSVEAAGVFFQSLLDSAGKLPDLRHLGVKTMLNIPWQARATMRQEWRDKLEKVFLRPFTPPSVSTTLRRSPAVKTAEKTDRKEKKAPHGPSAPPSRRSGRIIAHDQDLDSGGVGSNKSLRQQQSSRPSYRDPDTDEDEEETSASESDNVSESADEGQHEWTVQGMCNTVNIFVDNQKVVEQQFGMDDFLDEEVESEEEWDGDYEDDDDVVVF